jgi:carbonic anhydrase
MCEVNIEMQVRRIAATPIVENAWLRGQELHLHGWIYAIHDGLLRDLGPHLSSIAERDMLVSLDERVRDPSEPESAMRRQAIAVFAGLVPEMMEGLACPWPGCGHGSPIESVGT